MERVDYIARHPGRFAVTGAPSGYDAWLAVEAAARTQSLVVFVASDDVHAAAVIESAKFFAPALTVLSFPAWDCLPYDRVSPKPDIESMRLATLAALARADGPDTALVVTTVNAITQRVPPRDWVAQASFFARAGHDVDRERMVSFLAGNGYVRASTVREPGDFALRGGIVDLWPPGIAQPLRLDFFGETLEAIRRFDAETQLSSDQIDQIELLPASEVPLGRDEISRFRAGYVAAFGPANADDPLYESVSAGRKHPGMEHWLPLFYGKLDTLFDFVPRALLMLGHETDETRKARQELVRDYFETREDFRRQARGEDKPAIKAPPYKPLKPELLYLTDAEWNAALGRHNVRDLSPFQAPESSKSVDAGGKQGRDFQPERATGKTNVFEAAAEHIAALQKAGKRVVVASWSAGSSERMGGVLSDHGVPAIRSVADWPDAAELHGAAVGITVLGAEKGFEAPDFALISEQDILGDRMVRAQTRARRAQNFLSEASSQAPGDLVTHIEHGVGRYIGLKTIDALGAPHDCLELQYDVGKLFLPVETIELLTRYGADDSGAQLDRLGGAGWQARKARAKERVR
ncbi:MAG TPA: CarD family transcriptional regulator, partial [Rhizomicrobium sp.]